MTDDQFTELLERLETIARRYSVSRTDEIENAFESDRHHTYSANIVDAAMAISDSLDRVAEAIAGKKPKFEVDADGDPLGIGKKGGKKWN